MDPDFKAFARAWISRDRRLSELLASDPAAAEPLIARLAPSEGQGRGRK